MSGYDEAFYKMAEMLGVTDARAMSPADVFHNEILPALDQVLADAARYRWLMSDAVWNGTLGVRDGWIDFQFKDEAQEQIDHCMREDAGQ